MATRCCWPPESCVGVVAGPVGKADLVERVERQPPPLGAGHAAIDQRQFDVFQRRGARQQVEALEDEAEEMAAEHAPAGRGRDRRR